MQKTYFFAFIILKVYLNGLLIFYVSWKKNCLSRCRCLYMLQVEDASSKNCPSIKLPSTSKKFSNLVNQSVTCFERIRLVWKLTSNFERHKFESKMHFRNWIKGDLFDHSASWPSLLEAVQLRESKTLVCTKETISVGKVRLTYIFEAL